MNLATYKPPLKIFTTKGLNTTASENWNQLDDICNSLLDYYSISLKNVLILQSHHVLDTQVTTFVHMYFSVKVTRLMQ